VAGFRPFFNPATGEWIEYTTVAEDTSGALVRFNGHSAAGGSAWEEMIMTAIKTASAAPRQRTSPQNGLPERVPYVYGQETRRNTYAARIARRNAQGWWQPPADLPKPNLTRPQVPAGTAP
jgi:hypothetical protein